VGFVLLDLLFYVYCFVDHCLAIVLYVILRITDSDYPFGIFKLFFNILFSSIPLLVTIVSSTSGIRRAISMPRTCLYSIIRVDIKMTLNVSMNNRGYI